MPELPEVETVRRGLEMAIKGARIEQVKLRRKDLRIPFPQGFERALAGRAIVSIARRAKYLLFGLDNETILLAHLGMSGCFIVGAPQKPQTHDHFIATLADGRTLTYRDPRRFGLMTLVASAELPMHPLMAHLGPEPLEKTFSVSYLTKAMSARKSPVKTAIMDQELVVGVGNIYASEALFLARIHPLTPAHQAAQSAKRLHSAIRKVLAAAIESGGSSLRDFVDISGETGYFQHHFAVYDREGEPCVACGHPVGGIRLAGRSTFFCSQCQEI